MDSPDGRLKEIIRTFRGPIAVAAGLSFTINILALTGAIFMLQVYDRIIPSGSLQTLAVLLLLAFGLYVFMAAFDMLRSRIFLRMAQAADARFFTPVFDNLLGDRPRMERLQAVRDIDAVRQFISSNAPSTLFDLPWTLAFVVLLFLMHPAYGVETLLGLVIIVSLTLLTHRRTGPPIARVTKEMAERQRIVSELVGHGETVTALGMRAGLVKQASAAHWRVVEASGEAQTPADSIGAISKAVRLFFQSAILATGAWLVIEGAATAGDVRIVIAGHRRPDPEPGRAVRGVA